MKKRFFMYVLLGLFAFMLCPKVYADNEKITI